MALGGGIWMFQNKKIPGTYINFVSKVRASVSIADDEVFRLRLHERQA